ncbi:serine hydrolase domain-containing protein [Streptomyces clavuligerus]|uniref:Alkaline d-peptidase n=5 Tax=Streptomyces clavuligerus TaxID=1901 RepID=B5GUT9_STRCL|nr:serine hydrolase domain-containing protein [Streptomyces clavuligerus]ANW17590.1 alkaline D-peptidase [Streptomyces clavuligerus]AXU12141.1 class A beta-lactamase-related serine hydrolase [Streptomyces clavuligerus]EDY50085.1 D-stereospecific endopeptidase [Streptomyces clavuligerus]EFG09895.1 Alkaline d-peptidase [Streptomyces clavuligerus]MBY6302006.1 beta-lactamase family protein [Streptomyces clavuligerus]
MRVRTGMVGFTAAAVAFTVLTGPAQALDQGPGQGQGRAQGQAQEQGSGKRSHTQQALDELVRAGAVGVVARSEKQGAVWKGTAGVADRTTGKPRKANEHFRIGSITKTFVATVLLQLEAEGRLSLDDTVERHLPGLIRDGGNDGRKITVRQLLNHSSGLPEYLRNQTFYDRYINLPGFLENRYTQHSPADLVRTGMALGQDFAPGTRFSYSNTGYIVAGMIVEKVTGNRYEDEIRERIAEPLKLRGTGSPGTATGIPRPSARGYGVGPDGTLHDLTELSPTVAWSAGDMISTTADLNRFFGALLGGKVLPKKQLNAMKTTLPDPNGFIEGYGLGLYTTTTKCGTKLWGHAGGIMGWGADAVTTEDGRHTLAASANGGADGFEPVVDAEYCGTKKR